MTNGVTQWRPHRLFGLLLASCSLVHKAEVFDGTLSTSCGALQGAAVSQAPGVWAFRGLRYAAPPLGDLRWRPPQPATCSAQAKIPAARNGQACTQTNPIVGYFGVSNPRLAIRVVGYVLISIAFAIVCGYYAAFSMRSRSVIALHGGAGTEKLLGGITAPSNAACFARCLLFCFTLKCFLVGTGALYFASTHEEYLGRVIGGEDCLFLNIYAHGEQLTSPSELLPVVFFVHGGDLTSGSGMDSGPGAFYGGSHALAATRQAIAVQANYRLNALGFLYLEDLHGKSVFDSTNIGLLDQLSALQWVQKHISQFGGDPSRVTIYGQSSGGTSIAALLASPLARGLFHRAFSMSASPRIDATPSQAAAAWRKYFLPGFPQCMSKWHGEELRRCLHALTAEEMIAALPSQFSDPDWMDSLPVSKNSDPIIYMVVADGDVVLGNVSEVLSHVDPRLPNVPTVFGNVREECDLDLKQVHSQSRYDNAAWPFTEEQVMQWGVQLAGDMAFGDKVWNLYKPPHHAGKHFRSNPDASSSPIRQHWSQLTSDMRFICGNIYNAKQLSQGQKAPVYSYLFTHRPQSPVVSHMIGFPAWLSQDSSQYAFHMWDIILLFNRTAGFHNEDPDLGYTFTPLDFAVADRFRSAVLEFAETGQIASWTPVQPGAHSVCHVDLETKCDSHLKKEECALFNSYDVAYQSWIVN